MPWVLECDARAYFLTLAGLAAALDIEIVVPGHGEIVPGTMVATCVGYFADLLSSVRAARAAGLGSLEQAMTRLTLADRYAPDAAVGMAGLTAGAASLERAARVRGAGGSAGSLTAPEA